MGVDLARFVNQSESVKGGQKAPKVGGIVAGRKGKDCGKTKTVPESPTVAPVVDPPIDPPRRRMTADEVIASLQPVSPAQAELARPMTVTDKAWGEILEAAALGMDKGKLWAFSGLPKRAWDLLVQDEPWRAEAIQRAAHEGERDLARDVRMGEKAWESRAWLLERTRDGWSKDRGQGSQLHVAVALLGRFDSGEVLPNSQTVEAKALPEA